MSSNCQAPSPLETKFGPNQELSKTFSMQYEQKNYELSILLTSTYDNEEKVSIQLKDNIITYKYDLDKFCIIKNKNTNFFKVYDTPCSIYNYLITLNVDNIRILKENFDYKISFEDEHIKKLTENIGLIFLLNICMQNLDDIIKYLVCENNKKSNEIKLLKEQNTCYKKEFNQIEENKNNNIKEMENEIKNLSNKLNIYTKNNSNNPNIIKNLFISILIFLVAMVFSVLINRNINEKNVKIKTFTTKEITELQNSINDLIKKYYKIEKQIIKLNSKYDNLSTFLSNYEKVKDNLIKKIENIQNYLKDLAKYFDFTNYFKDMNSATKSTMKSLNFRDLFKKAKESLNFNPLRYVQEKLEQSKSLESEQ